MSIIKKVVIFCEKPTPIKNLKNLYKPGETHYTNCPNKNVRRSTYKLKNLNIIYF